MKYQQIREQKQTDTNNLFTSLGVFWAFSNKQFDENKTPLQEGEKYVDIGGGGFIPKHNVDALIEGMKTIDKTFKQATKDAKMREKHILYELNNHECFYTGDITDAVEVLGEDYTEQEVRNVYKHYKAKKYIVK